MSDVVFAIGETIKRKIEKDDVEVDIRTLNTKRAFFISQSIQEWRVVVERLKISLKDCCAKEEEATSKRISIGELLLNNELL